MLPCKQRVVGATPTASIPYNFYAVRSKESRSGSWEPVEAGASPAIAISGAEWAKPCGFPTSESDFSTVGKFDRDRFLARLNSRPTSVDPGLMSLECPERYRGLQFHSKNYDCPIRAAPVLGTGLLRAIGQGSKAASSVMSLNVPERYRILLPVLKVSVGAREPNLSVKQVPFC